MSRPRLFVIEPAMNNRVGHAYWFSKRLSGLFRNAGFDPIILGHQQLTAEMLYEGLEPYFSLTPFDQPSTDPLAAGWENFEQVGHALSEELDALSDRIDPDRDAIYFPTCPAALIHAVALWQQKQPQMRRLKGVLGMGLRSGLDLESGAADLTACLFRVAFNKLPSDSALSLVATNEFENREFSFLASRPAFPVSWPVIDTAPRAGRLARQDTLFTVLCPGVGHSGQRFDLLDQVIQIVAQTSSLLVRFVCQTGVETPQTLKGPNVEVVHLPRGLEAEDYCGLFVDSDCVLLPYDRSHFRSTISGQFGLACHFATPCLVPEGTTMSRLLDQEPQAGTVIKELSAPAIAKAVCDMAVNRELHQAAMRRLSVHFRQQHGIDAYAKDVVALLRV